MSFISTYLAQTFFRITFAMLLPASLLPLLVTATAAGSVQQQPQHIFSNPSEHNAAFKIPTVHESAVMARRILHLSSTGTLVTSFPVEQKGDVNTLENRPQAVEGSPIGLMEYVADCEPDTGNPTMLAINIATPYRNFNAGSNVSLALKWWPKESSIYSSGIDENEIPTPHTPAALPRFSLHGYLEPIPRADLLKKLVPACFIRTHPDSALWQPGNDVHESEYLRFVVEHIYWLGGFGDRARIGWLPVEAWKNVTRDEIDQCRLPGEEKKNAWFESLKEWL